jgi:hypothetical protein
LCGPTVMVVDQVYVPAAPDIGCHAAFRRVLTCVGVGPPVTTTMNLKSVLVVPDVGVTDPVNVVEPHAKANVVAGVVRARSMVNMPVTANALTDRLRKRCLMSNGRPELPFVPRP